MMSARARNARTQRVARYGQIPVWISSGNQNDAGPRYARKLFEERAGDGRSRFTEDRFADDGGDRSGRHAFKELVECRQRIVRGNACRRMGTARKTSLQKKGPKCCYRAILRSWLAPANVRRDNRAVKATTARTRVYSRAILIAFSVASAGRQQQVFLGAVLGRSPVELFGHAKIRLVHCNLKQV